MKTLNRTFIGLFATALLAAAGTAIAAGPAAAAHGPSKEMREKMAVVHEQMAACLRSIKSITACRAEMMQHCREIAPGGCPGMGSGMRHHRMMPSPRVAADPDK